MVPFQVASTEGACCGGAKGVGEVGAYLLFDDVGAGIWDSASYLSGW